MSQLLLNICQIFEYSTKGKPLIVSIFVEYLLDIQHRTGPSHNPIVKYFNIEHLNWTKQEGEPVIV